MSAFDIIQFLHQNRFDLYFDHWNEQHLYFGKHGNAVQDVDHLFGSDKFNLPLVMKPLEDAAVRILSNPIDPPKFNQRNFLKSHTDVIAIERGLSSRMKERFLGIKYNETVAVNSDAE